MITENMFKLKAFFDDGAPDYCLDMNQPYAKSATFGSGGCIAGAAFMLTKVDARPGIYSWEEIRDVALEFTGLNSVEDPEIGHALFDPDLVQEAKHSTDITPENASRAIQNVIEGKDPWREEDFMEAI